MMKNFFVLFMVSVLMPFPLLASNVAKKVYINYPGTLNSLMSHQESLNLTELKILGKVNEKDFSFMRDSMPVLSDVDMKEAIICLSGNENVSNAIPAYAFCNNDGSFVGKQSLKSIILPQFTKSIDFCAFSGCSALEKIVIPSTLERIANYAFDSCFNLSEIQFPDGLISIGDGAFSDCIKLKKLLFPQFLTSIGEECFANCALNSCEIKAKTPPTIHSNSFDERLIAVYVPKGSGEIYQSADFWNNKVILDRDVNPIHLNVQKPGTLASEILAAGFSLEKVNGMILEGQLDESDFSIIRSHMPNLLALDLAATKIISIPESAFINKRLLKVALPSGLVSIESNAFKNCIGLSEISLPCSLLHIKSSAFRNCINLSEVKTLSPTPQKIGADVWMNVDKKTCKILVPKGASTAYMVSPNWNVFSNISEVGIQNKYEIKVLKCNGGVIKCNSKNVDNGELIAVSAGDNLVFKVVPDKGYSIGTVLFNKENVTSKLQDGMYNAYTINSSGTFFVSFIKDQYNVSIMTLSDDGSVNKLNASSNNFPSIYLKINNDEKLSIDKFINSDGINISNTDSLKKYFPFRGDVTLVVDYSAVKRKSYLTDMETKVWVSSGIAYVKSDRPIKNVELLTMSGKFFQAKMTDNNISQLDMKHEKNAVIKIVYKDGSLENIMVSNDK